MIETPVLRQYREAKEAHPDGILFFRMGDFYEIFFDDARVAAPAMGVTLTSRPMGKGGRHPMCGVPYHSWESYAGRLLRAGHKVVICEQMEAPTGRGVVRREVTRVLTPGTVLEEAYLDPAHPNRLVAAFAPGAEAGIAWCDLSAGELMLCQLPSDRLPAELDRLQAAELLTPPAVDEYRFDHAAGRRRLRDQLGIAHEAAIGAGSAPLAVAAAGVLLGYLTDNRIAVSAGLLRVRTYSPDATMQLDAATVRNLEIPALVALVDRCATAAGSRRLRSWLHAPLRDVETVEMRLRAVTELREDGRARDGLASGLKPAGDLERLITRAAHGIAPPRELAALRRALEALPGVKRAASALEALETRRLTSRIADASATAALLAAAIVDDPPATSRDGGVIRPGFDGQLDGIRTASSGAREWIAGFEAAERERTGIRSLKVGFNRVFGYYIELGRAAGSAVPDGYIRRQTVTTGERYITPELKEREAVVLNARQDLVSREAEVLRELASSVAAAAAELIDTAHAVAELDALAALAEAAADLGWCRPVVDESGRLTIRAGRHPLVEAALPPGSFAANDTDLDLEHRQVTVITGPNMAGKSTYLRQVALIVLLAQCGSHVPAGEATVGIADRIFTRVGAHDDLAAGMSTFMVEMAETASILAHATPRSLVVFDEVGRGTSTYDGLSIAQAVVEHIHDSPRLGCRTLFATHYHELTALADRLPRLHNERVEVAERDGSVTFLHRVVPGGADRSYGIHVAALAGLPSAVVARARDILEDLERRRPLEPPSQQLGLPLEAPPDPVREELATLDIDRLSPLEALQKLYEIRGRLG